MTRSTLLDPIHMAVWGEGCFHNHKLEFWIGSLQMLVLLPITYVYLGNSLHLTEPRFPYKLDIITVCNSKGYKN